jgi:hypothetical protein
MKMIKRKREVYVCCRGGREREREGDKERSIFSKKKCG